MFGVSDQKIIIALLSFMLAVGGWMGNRAVTTIDEIREAQKASSERIIEINGKLQTVLTEVADHETRLRVLEKMPGPISYKKARAPFPAPEPIVFYDHSVIAPRRRI